MRHAPLLLLAAALGCATSGTVTSSADDAGEAGHSAPRLVAVFEDARDDADGPGGYVNPGDTQFQPGDFDLRRFAVMLDGDDVLFEVTMGADIRVPQDLYRTSSTPANLTNNLYLQNIDIYIDTDPSSAAGHTACVPGRRVAFADGRSWKRAVILTPQPGLARSVTTEALPVAARKMIFPNRIQLRGRTLVARVPADQLGGLPTRAWGYSVHVSGAAWDQNLKVVDRLTGTVEANAFTLPVLTLREAFAFGGAPSGDAYPRVVDVLLPLGQDQRAVLGSYQSAGGSWARIPFLYPEPPGPAPAPIGATEEAAAALPKTAFTVVDVSDTMVTISGPVKELRPMQLGQVLGAKGEPVARLVIVQLLEKGAVASVVDHRAEIEAGARVRFENAAGEAPILGPVPPPSPDPPPARPATP